MCVINSIANEKGWEDRRRKHENKFGYHFTAIADPSVFCRIVANNPVDAANRLREADVVVRSV